VAEPLRQEITPKNILMTGPTCVGKTEIAFEAVEQSGAAVTIDAAYVNGKLQVLVEREDLARYVL